MVRVADADAGRAGGPVTIPRTEERIVRAPDGQAYRLLLAWPEQPPPPAGFPVVYVLDAATMFATVVESIRLRSRRPDATGIVPAIVAGLAVAGDDRQVRARRIHDYTPTAGATAFRHFLVGEVQPLVARAMAIDETRQALCGHSLGGLFVLDSLLSGQPAFQSYLAISPSIWAAREQLFAAVVALDAAPARPLSQCRVMITVGEFEQALAPWQSRDASTEDIERRRSDRRMVDDARELAGRLTGVAGRVQFEECRGEDHASVILPSLAGGLRFALSSEALARPE